MGRILRDGSLSNRKTGALPREPLPRAKAATQPTAKATAKDKQPAKTAAGPSLTKRQRKNPQRASMEIELDEESDSDDEVIPLRTHVDSAQILKEVNGDEEDGDDSTVGNEEEEEEEEEGILVI